jgi:uncharacterized protein (TIGR02001 family)
MKTLLALSAALAGVLSANAAAAQDTAPPKPITVTGSVAITTDYRLRGVSQSDEGMAIQGGLTVAHESGFYGSLWGSNLAGWGAFGGSNMELDLVAGYKHSLEGGAIDVGVTNYFYPSGLKNTYFYEPYAKLSGTLGPASALVGIAYAPSQKALGNWTPALGGAPGKSGDNLYLWTDISGAVPNTPVTLKAHLGYSDGNPGLGPNGTSVAPTGKYVDWLVGADVAVPGTPLTLSAAYVDTNITKSEEARLNSAGVFANYRNGDSIADGKVVFTISAAF